MPVLPWYEAPSDDWDPATATYRALFKKRGDDRWQINIFKNSKCKYIFVLLCYDALRNNTLILKIIV